MFAKSLSVLAVIVFAACTTVPSQPNTKEITALEAIALLEKGEAVVLDVRNSKERIIGKPIPQTIPIQFGPDQWSGEVSRVDTSRFLEQVTKLESRLGGKLVIILCQYGVRSGAAQKVLEKIGIRALSVGDGYRGNSKGPGWEAWQ